MEYKNPAASFLQTVLSHVLPRAEVLRFRRDGSSAILIEGARRIGKSFIAQKLAKDEYKSYIMIDFSNFSPEIRDVFENESYDLKLFFTKLQIFYNVKLYPRESLIVKERQKDLSRGG